MLFIRSIFLLPDRNTVHRILVRDSPFYHSRILRYLVFIQCIKYLGYDTRQSGDKRRIFRPVWNDIQTLIIRSYPCIITCFITQTCKSAFTVVYGLRCSGFRLESLVTRKLHRIRGRFSGCSPGKGNRITFRKTGGGYEGRSEQAGQLFRLILAWSNIQ